MAEKKKITVEEKQRLEELEDIIRKDIKGFLRVGMALKEIRESRLYREKYDTWKDYLRAEWDMGKTIGNYQITAYEIVEDIKQNGHKCGHFKRQDISNTHNCAHSEIVLPANEAQVRPLSLLETPFQQRTAWQRALELSDGKPTAKIVREVVEEINNKKIDQEVEVLEDDLETEESKDDQKTKELTQDELEFREHYRQMIGLMIKNRKSGWKTIRRKFARERVKSFDGFLK